MINTAAGWYREFLPPEELHSPEMDESGWDAEAGLRSAELLAHLRSVGKPMPIKGSLIAATALTRGLQLAIRNRKDFEASGIELVDPFV